MKRKYAIVDIETTGGLSKRDKITELGVVISDGTNIIKQYETLVNPERSIPSNITRITGITNEMVVDAPKFFEVAKELIDLLDGCVFVAHNVRFDYGFIREEFRQLGYTFTMSKVCTVVMSKRAFPRLRSYSLGNLIRHFEIPVNARHRALEDAVATTEIFHMILSKFETKDALKIMLRNSIKQTRIPDNVDIQQLENLPETCGVYYFLDQGGRVIYVGKSVNIKKRVISHFGKASAKSEKIMQKVCDVSYEETGSELLAFLKEAIEIKELKPAINKLQKTVRMPYGIYVDYDKDGYLLLRAGNKSNKKLEKKSFLQSFEKLFQAKQRIKTLSEKLDLCLKLNRLEKTSGPCFNYNINKCSGVCLGSELPHSYNERARQAAEILETNFDDNFVIIDEGRSNGERSVVLVEEGEFKGYGYIDRMDVQLGIEELKEAVNYSPLIPAESNSIIRHYINKNADQIKLHYF